MIARSALLLSMAVLAAVAAIADPGAGAPPSEGADPPPGAFYVDCADGSDDNAGTLPDAAWQSLGRLAGSVVAPGTIIRLRRGCEWDGGLTVEHGGATDAPVTYTSYGRGSAPVVTNGAGGSGAPAIEVEAPYVVLDGLAVRDAGGPGVWLRPGADHVIVRRLEISGAGIGVQSEGSHNLITDNYVHDLEMVVDTEGGDDDDFGATCFWLTSGPTEMSYNLGRRCRAASHDYGTDGGFVEAWQDAHDAYIHHNRAEDTRGFAEIGGRAGDVHDLTFAYNVMWNTGGALCAHTDGVHATAIDGIRFDHNTYVDASSAPVFDCLASDRDRPSLRVRNNIFSTAGPIGDGGLAEQSRNIHDIPPGAQDPRFVDREGGDFHLSPESPAIDSGLELGYRLDIDGVRIPVGAGVDIGAVEYIPSELGRAGRREPGR